MKNLFVATLVAIAVLGINSIATANDVTPEKNDRQVELFDVLRNVVDFPTELDSNVEASVWVTFKVEDDGEVNPLAITGEQRYANHVRKELADVKVQNQNYFGHMYRIKITFNLEEK